MALFYDSAPGRWLSARLLCRPLLSALHGFLQQHPVSRRRIAPFIALYHIDMSAVETPEAGFRSFNDFFIRKLKTGTRPICNDPLRLVAPADSRMRAFKLRPDTHINVKGARWSLSRLLETTALNNEYSGGLCLCFRLAPCDYHRFGYTADGVQGQVHTIQGLLHSVSPLALRHKADILATNFRQWCLIQSRNAGTIIQVEVGAMTVGSIVQHQPHGGPCRRGGEKGYFQLGGSTILLIFESDQVQLDADIVRYSDRGIETLVRYGEGIGKKVL